MDRTLDGLALRWHSRKWFYVLVISSSELYLRIAGYGVNCRWRNPYRYIAFLSRAHLKTISDGATMNAFTEYNKWVKSDRLKAPPWWVAKVDEYGRIMQITPNYRSGIDGPIGGPSVCNGCQTDMPKIWDVACKGCRKTFCYDCVRAASTGSFWYCAACNPAKDNK